jgi:hypothetical protein
VLQFDFFQPYLYYSLKEFFTIDVILVLFDLGELILTEMYGIDKVS